MSEGFNLNIENYNDNEIEDLLDLSYPYTKEQLLTCKEKMKDKLLADQNLGMENQHKVIQFLEM